MIIACGDDVMIHHTIFSNKNLIKKTCTFYFGNTLEYGSFVNE